MDVKTEAEWNELWTRDAGGNWVASDKGREYHKASITKRKTARQPWEPALEGAIEGVGEMMKKLKEHFEEKIAALENKQVDLVDPLTGLAERIEALEAREERTLADCYQGGHSPNTTYKRGAVISHAGGLWLAMSQTSERPGSTPAWRLILRSER